MKLPPMESRPAWPDAGGKKILAYLNPIYRDFEIILQVLSSLPCCTLVIAAGVSEKIVQKYSGPSLQFTRGLVDLETVRHECDLTVCHAAHGTTNHMLLAGRPLLLLPIYLEQTLTAINVLKRGAGLVVDPAEKTPDYKKLILRLIEDGSFTESAQAIASKYRDLDLDYQLEQMLLRCEELMGNSGKAGA
jgi:UDP:flavonoid glycosyltransferase YjiC (YdhE family)